MINQLPTLTLSTVRMYICTDMLFYMSFGCQYEHILSQRSMNNIQVKTCSTSYLLNRIKELFRCIITLLMIIVFITPRCGQSELRIWRAFLLISDLYQNLMHQCAWVKLNLLKYSKETYIYLFIGSFIF